MTVQEKQRYMAVCARLDEGRRVADICRELGVARHYVYRVRDGERHVWHIPSPERRAARADLDAAYADFQSRPGVATYGALVEAREAYNQAK